jgi:hypothetical protein
MEHCTGKTELEIFQQLIVQTAKKAASLWWPFLFGLIDFKRRHRQTPILRLLRVGSARRAQETGTPLLSQPNQNT